MSNFKISVASHDKNSVLSAFLLKQLSSIEWIDADACVFDDINKKTGTDIFVSVLDGLDMQQIMNVNSIFRNEKKTTIFVSFWNNKLIAGPVFFPGHTSGADACFLFLNKEYNNGANKASITNIPFSENHLQQNTDKLYKVFADILQELKNIYFDTAEELLKLIEKVNIYDTDPKNINPKGVASKNILSYFGREESHKDPLAPVDYKILFQKYIHSKSQAEKRLFSGVNHEAGSAYKNIAVVGGGTAGYFAALSLKKKYPGLKITIIESSKIPVIGVGEATTPYIRSFLFNTLEYSPLEFYERVKPTWKLGIQFFWGLPGDHYFNYPFGKPDLRSAFINHGNINQASLTSFLMDTDSSFVTSTIDKEGKEKYASMSDEITYALHLDNVALINYLKEKAIAADITFIDDMIVDAEKNSHVNEIDCLIGEDGKRYEYDFFVDCTGFKSLLIEKIMGSPYVSYSNSLFTDTAVTGYIPDIAKIKPYTLAESMNHGWCWDIPMRGESHRGYVFSSAHCSADTAADEITAKNPTIQDLKTVRFRSGRHQEICVGNVFAIGNSFAFVEPLESTGLHMILSEVEILTQNLPYLKNAPVLRKTINTSMNDHWDYIRDFLAIHYKFNKKFDTPFWKDCREMCDISSIQWLIDLYHEMGLLSSTTEEFKNMIKREIKDDIFALVGFDAVLLGQGVVPKNFDRSFVNKNIWERNLKTWKALQANTIPIEKDLMFLAKTFNNKALLND